MPMIDRWDSDGAMSVATERKETRVPEPISSLPPPQAPLPPPSLGSLVPGSGHGARFLTKAESKTRRRAAKELQKSEKAQQKDEHKAATVAAATADPTKHGAVLAKETFSGKTVQIFQNGYVKVSGPLSRNAPIERLISISDDANITKKTGLGRGLGFVATGGLNMLSSNKRGDIYLTIVTDQQTHLLHVEAPPAWEMKAAKKLAGAALRVTPETENSPTTDQSVPPVGVPPVGSLVSPAERLRQLASLHAEGLLSDEEFAAKRDAAMKDL